MAWGGVGVELALKKPEVYAPVLENGPRGMANTCYEANNCNAGSDERGRACSTNGEKRNAYSILVGKPEGKRPLGSLRRWWVDNIKMDLREIGWDGMVWIGLIWLRIGTNGRLL
jgi:hypothetical protein